jgi:dihydroorotate dehydrogenase
MGFNNDGVEIIAKRLKQWKQDSARLNGQAGTLLVGGNIGKNKLTPNESAWMDYEACFKGLFDFVDYFVVNVSSPNTPGLRELQEKGSLKKIISHLQSINDTKPNPKPLLLKIAPDLAREQLDDIIELSLELKLNGLVATNTTIEREFLKTDKEVIGKIGAGGLSGKPLMERSTEVLQYLSQHLNGRIPVMASGGIFTGSDAKEKFDRGACLIQVWTGFIYEGPFVVKNICRYLLELAFDQNK